MRVLITGARAPVAVDLARRYHAAGDQVFLADSLRFPLGRFSRAVRRFFFVSRPNDSPHRYAMALLGIARAWKIDLLIPTCEEVYYIARYKDMLGGVCRILVDDLDKLERIHNKWSFARIAQGCGALIPETRLFAAPEELSLFQIESQQWVFKPVYSRFASETVISPEPDELARIVPHAARQWIGQRLVHGTEYSTYSVARDGNLLAHAAYVSTYRAGRGSGIFLMPRQHAGIADFVRRFVRQENFTGQIGFDFIESPDGRLWVLEGNPRATSGLHLFAASDPLTDVLSGRSHELVEATGAKPCMLGFAMALWGLAQALRQGQLPQFVRDCLQAEEIVFHCRDPFPMAFLPFSTAELLAICFRERKILREAATFDIEWNGEPM